MTRRVRSPAAAPAWGASPTPQEPGAARSAHSLSTQGLPCLQPTLLSPPPGREFAEAGLPQTGGMAPRQGRGAGPRAARLPPEDTHHSPGRVATRRPGRGAAGPASDRGSAGRSPPACSRSHCGRCSAGPRTASPLWGEETRGACRGIPRIGAARNVPGPGREDNGGRGINFFRMWRHTLSESKYCLFRE